MESNLVPSLRQVVVAGAAAGDVAVADIQEGDVLVSVIQHEIDTGSVVDVVDLTSEFTIGDGVINNDDGTATTGDKLVVTWYARDDRGGHLDRS